MNKMRTLQKAETNWPINSLVSYIETESMGLGLIAIKDINRNTEILCDPVRSFTKQDAALLRKTSAYPLFFVDPTSYRSKHNDLQLLHLVLGPISMLNHHDNGNCRVGWEKATRENCRQVKLIAKRDINAGEELFISYHNIDEYSF